MDSVPSCQRAKRPNSALPLGLPSPKPNVSGDAVERVESNIFKHNSDMIAHCGGGKLEENSIIDESSSSVQDHTDPYLADCYSDPPFSAPGSPPPVSHSSAFKPSSQRSTYALPSASLVHLSSPGSNSLRPYGPPPIAPVNRPISSGDLIRIQLPPTCAQLGACEPATSPNPHSGGQNYSARTCSRLLSPSFVSASIPTPSAIVHPTLCDPGSPPYTTGLSIPSVIPGQLKQQRFLVQPSTSTSLSRQRKTSVANPSMVSLNSMHSKYVLLD
ncbi:unnamed protein product [Protopolystoma xenopodis]|uniref:Uncharacterized protein n=1 Tax=Protopolystoma xenopodis TaxID=117903 RepID=A0A448XQB4_9PLAT|nr:unnamed protein product [Protopolystoma xenopodis]